MTMGYNDKYPDMSAMYAVQFEYENKLKDKIKELEIDWLGQVATLAKCDDDLCREFTKRKLAEIKTALEQKDKL